MCIFLVKQGPIDNSTIVYIQIYLLLLLLLLLLIENFGISHKLINAQIYTGDELFVRRIVVINVETVNRWIMGQTCLRLIRPPKHAPRHADKRIITTARYCNKLRFALRFSFF